MACDTRLLGALVLSPYRAIFKPPLEVVVMTKSKSSIWWLAFCFASNKMFTKCFSTFNIKIECKYENEVSRLKKIYINIKWSIITKMPLFRQKFQKSDVV